MAENPMTPVSTANAEFQGHSARFKELIGDFDERTAQVLAAHFTVERELDVTLNYFLPRPDKLGILKFGHKVQLLRACCPDNYVDVFLEPVIRLDHLRNALAHNNKVHIASCFEAFLGSLDEFAKEGVDATAEGIVTAARILTESLTFIRVENFSAIEVSELLGVHSAALIRASPHTAPE